MKKKIAMLIFGLVLVLGIAACSEATDMENQNEEVNKEKAVEKTADEAIETEKETEVSEKNGPTDSSEAKETLASFTEGEIIQQEVDIKGLKVDVKTDNEHKRIILLTADNQQANYKTIYLKDKKILKIIDTTNDNGQIFQGTIS